MLKKKILKLLIGSNNQGKIRGNKGFTTKKYFGLYSKKFRFKKSQGNW